jgi:hypothetical protein
MAKVYNKFDGLVEIVPNQGSVCIKVVFLDYGRFPHSSILLKSVLLRWC